MKPITLHPSSLLVGVALAGLAFFTMAQTPQPINPSLTRPSSPSFIRAQDMVRITEGTPYVVPPNKWFVVTALGCKPVPGAVGWSLNHNLGFVELSANGTVELQAIPDMLDGAAAAIGNGTNLREVPRGLSFPAGSVIEVSDTFFANSPYQMTAASRSAEAWGFLSDS